MALISFADAGNKLVTDSSHSVYVRKSHSRNRQKVIEILEKGNVTSGVTTNKFIFIAVIGFMLGPDANAATIIRGFEDRSDGLFTDQYSEFSITSDTLGATLEVYTFAVGAVEGSKFLTIQNPIANTGSTGNGIFTANAGYEFLGISFNGIESSLGTKVATVSLFTSDNVSLGVLDVLASESSITPVTMDFSSYGAVGRFEVRDITDVGGFLYDRILVNSVPEPSALSLLAVGLGGLIIRRRRS